MESTELAKAATYGKQGGKLTLANYGRAHFVKAANIRWKRYRLEQARKRKALKSLTKKVYGKKAKV